MLIHKHIWKKKLIVIKKCHITPWQEKIKTLILI